jgi:hypothetical protein
VNWAVSQFGPLIAIAGVVAACAVLACAVALVLRPRAVRRLGRPAKLAWTDCTACSGGTQGYDGSDWGPLSQPPQFTRRQCRQCLGLGGHWKEGRE